MKKILLLMILLIVSNIVLSQTTIKIPNLRIPIVELMVNGKKGKFLLDTGASFSTIHHNISDKYYVIFTPTNNAIVGLNGTSKIYDVSNLTLSIENEILSEIIFKGQNLNSLIKSVHQTLHIEIIGVLGLDFIRNNNLTIDFGKKELIVINK